MELRLFCIKPSKLGFFLCGVWDFEFVNDMKTHECSHNADQRCGYARVFSCPSELIGRTLLEICIMLLVILIRRWISFKLL